MVMVGKEDWQWIADVFCELIDNMNEYGITDCLEYYSLGNIQDFAEYNRLANEFAIDVDD